MLVVFKVFISTIPFGTIDPTPIKMLEEAGIEYLVNPTGRKLREGEIDQYLPEVHALVAGTEQLNVKTLSMASNLKLVSRVGIGLDSVDVSGANSLGIGVSNTPEGPTAAVIELAIGCMLALLRHIPKGDSIIRQKDWQRLVGRRIACCKVGVIGAGRTGGGVIRQLIGGFPGVEILAFDLEKKEGFSNLDGFRWASKDEIFDECDVVTLHVPLGEDTRHMVDASVLRRMKRDAILLNLARGGIVQEADLYDALKRGDIMAAAIDVFEEEPYKGPLTELENCLLTAHQGSMTVDCRTKMEIEAVEEVIRLYKGLPLKNPVNDVARNIGL